LRLIFAGTPAFARTALERLHAAGHTVALVLTQPDRPAGRGMKLQPSPVKQFALEQGLALAQPTRLRLDGAHGEQAAQARALIQHAQAQAMVVVAYGLILPQWVLDDMSGPGQRGCFNIHASLLPRWRGAAPIHRAIEAGDAQTGVTIMQMDAGLDTGPMLMQSALTIAPDESTATLHDRLAVLGADLMLQTLAQVDQVQPQQQPQEGVCYAHKIEKTEAAIDWRQPAAVIARKVRAWDPFPGASASLQGETLKVWAAQACDPQAQAGQESDAGQAATKVPPGYILAANGDGILVATGEGGCVRLTQLQRPGGKRLAAAPFLQGHPLASGQCFAVDVLGGAH